MEQDIQDESYRVNSGRISSATDRISSKIDQYGMEQHLEVVNTVDNVP